MFGVKTERTGSANCPPLYVGLLMIAGTISVAAQTANPAQAGRSSRPPIIPKNCLAQAHHSDKIGEVQESIQDHPTAGAYNTLGALYAQEGQISCAISAFEASILVQDPNWEAHYNLGIALVQHGDQARAEHELRTAIQQKADSLTSRFALAGILEAQKPVEAEEQLRIILKQDPRFVPAILK